MSREKFDMWARSYDEDVKQSNEKNEYPFAGYEQMMSFIHNMIRADHDAKILDIGFGTGQLTRRFYNDGHEIHGVDVSGEMIKTAKEQMPDARLVEWDFADGLPEEMKGEKYDAIISTYAMHHLDDKTKVEFINSMKEMLSINGKIIIGDVAFECRSDHDQCREKHRHIWDHDEIYMVFEEIGHKLNFKLKDFKSISHCAGIILLADY